MWCCLMRPLYNYIFPWNLWVKALILCHYSALHQNFLLHLTCSNYFCLNKSLLWWLQNDGLLTPAPPPPCHLVSTQHFTISKQPPFSSSIYFLPPFPPSLPSFFSFCICYWLKTYRLLYFQWFIIHFTVLNYLGVQFFPGLTKELLVGVPLNWLLLFCDMHALIIALKYSYTFWYNKMF